jgi:dienelactone hydrolase
VRVSAPTRLDWAFAAAGFGPAAAKLPPDYDSLKQRYLLFVPKTYDAKKAWPLVVFISPGDEPGGWAAWRAVCEREGVLFCAPFGAGNNCPAGKRTRIVLDALDDVRRHYRVDPAQTYATGFSGGGRMACTIAFSLPEYFAGAAPLCGTNPLPSLTYLRHRIQDRFSVAFVTGEKDFNRKENEAYLYPQFDELGIRAKLWVVPKLGHAVPPPQTLAAVYAWLAGDVKRRRADAEERSALAVAPDEAPDGPAQAARLLKAAKAELRRPEHTWRGVVLLQGVLQRWGKTEAAGKARKLLSDIQDDDQRLRLVERQGGADERRTLLAQAKSFEGFGRPEQAVQAYELLVRHHPDTPEGKRAAAALKRLRAPK